MRKIRKRAKMSVVQASVYNVKVAEIRDQFSDCRSFVRNCRDALLHEFQNRVPPGKSGKVEYCFSRVAQAAIDTVVTLIAAGDPRLASRLPSWIEALSKADCKFGNDVKRGDKDLWWYNRFASYLQQGSLWNDGVLTPIQWSNSKPLPATSDWKSWVSVAMEFLRKRFGDEPSRLTVFLPMLARRKGEQRTTRTPEPAMRLLKVYSPKEAKKLKGMESSNSNWTTKGKLTLLNNGPSFQWKAIEKELKRAFRRLATPHRKRGPS